MDTNDNTQQQNADDTELANVLQGINRSVVPSDQDQTDSGLQFEETPIPDNGTTAPVEDTQTDESMNYDTPPVVEEPVVETPDPLASGEEPTSLYPGDDSSVTPTTTETPSELDDIKKSALEELRPLVGKLDLPADEKFDTLLLIIRSIDDKTLVSTAYDVAKTIEDETRRAQALIDVIKEIDYFDNQGK